MIMFMVNLINDVIKIQLQMYTLLIQSDKSNIVYLLKNAACRYIYDKYYFIQVKSRKTFILLDFRYSRKLANNCLIRMLCILIIFSVTTL